MIIEILYYIFISAPEIFINKTINIINIPVINFKSLKESNTTTCGNYFVMFFVIFDIVFKFLFCCIKI